MRVQEILAIKGTVLYTVGPRSTLGEAVATMTEQDIGSLVVFDSGRMVGMLTFREVLKATNALGEKWQSARVLDVMMQDPVAASPDMEMDDLRRLMLKSRMRYLPVMSGSTLQGVISFHDVAKAVLEEERFENRMLKNYIQDRPEASETNQGVS